MQSGTSRPAAARRVSMFAHGGRLGALLFSLAAAACANIGQIGNLTEDQHITVAFESVDGPPTAVVHKFVRTLKDEAQARQIAVVAPDKADYRLRGYLAAQAEGEATSIAWAWDVYGAGQRRTFRLTGEDKYGPAGPQTWATADDEALRRIAQSAVQQLALFIATARPSSPATAEPPAPQRRSSTFAWLDDWTPEASGIFRIFRRGPQPSIAADAGLVCHPPAGSRCRRAGRHRTARPPPPHLRSRPAIEPPAFGRRAEIPG